MDLSKLSDAELEKLAGREASDFSSMSDEDLERLANGGPLPTTSKLEAGLRGAAQGATFGFADELAGAGESLYDVATTDKELGDLKDLYAKHRDESRANFNRAQTDNPFAYGAGELGGAVATSLIPIGAAGRGIQAAEKLTKAEKALAYLKSIGKLGATGAGLGGLSAAGASEGETLSEVGRDVLRGAGTGAALGAATGVAMPLVQKGAEKVGQALKDFAEDRAFKAAGAIKKHFAKVGKKGAKRANEIGRELLDEGHVTPFSSVDDVTESIQRGVDEKSQILNEAIGRADEVAANTSLSPAQQAAVDAAKFNPAQVAERLKAEIRAQYPGVPEAKIQPALDEVDSWLANQVEDMSARALQDSKVSMNRFLKDSDFYKNPNTGIAREGMTSVRRALKEGIENKGDAAAQILGDETGAIRSTNKSLGNLLEAQNAAIDAQARESGNRFFGLTDNILGAAGGAAEGAREGDADGVLKGMAIGFLGGKAIRKYGAPLSAVAADRASKFLLRNSGMRKLAAQNPAAFKALANDFAQRVTPRQNIPMSADNEYDGTRHVSEEEARQKFVNGN